jgi:hypothetical protein
VAYREDNQQSQQQAVRRPDEAEDNLVLVGLVTLPPPVREHRQRDTKGDHSPEDEDADNHGKRKWAATGTEGFSPAVTLASRSRAARAHQSYGGP